MKKTYFILIMLVSLFSCNGIGNRFSNLQMEDLCGKRYTSSVSSSTVQGVTHDTGTTLNCDGTFESGAVTRMTGQNSRNRGYYTGKWKIVTDIPDEVISAVKRYGIEHTNYTIIEYSSSNGVTDYCVYYPSSYDGSPVLGTLNVHSDPDDAGIYDGYPED